MWSNRTMKRRCHPGKDDLSWKRTVLRISWAVLLQALLVAVLQQLGYVEVPGAWQQGPSEAEWQVGAEAESGFQASLPRGARHLANEGVEGEGEGESESNLSSPLLLELELDSAPGSPSESFSLPADSDAAPSPSSSPSPSPASPAPAPGPTPAHTHTHTHTHKGSEGQEVHEGHAQLALFFLFDALLIGCAVLHLTMFEHFHSLQFTVVVFVLGMIYSIVHIKFQTYQAFNLSFLMWTKIDSHLLLWTLLPPLILGDAMSIDTSVAANVAKQCLFLAGPGVVLCAIPAAYCLWLVLGWTPMLCLSCGAIFAATDPVAVVGLLKELGASPTLTAQIQGESLLNDGTSIVLYTVAYTILSGDKQYGFESIAVDIMQKVLGAVGLGMYIGFIFNGWIAFAADHFHHASGLIQVSLTICCAYCAWMVAEGIFETSGVLCTVSAALVLADDMWRSIVHKESMEHIWHTVEFIGNALIFFLAGAVNGKVMMDDTIELRDYGILIFIYIALNVIRYLVLRLSQPLLTRLSGDGSKVSTEDVMIMTWGGLRGALGLALAIQVRSNLADGHITREEGDRVLFYTGGVACLTLVINATTCPTLVNYLGVAKTSTGQRWLLGSIHTRLSDLFQRSLAADNEQDRRINPNKPEVVRQIVLEALDKILEETVDRDTLQHRGSVTSFNGNSAADFSAVDTVRERLQSSAQRARSAMRRWARSNFDLTGDATLLSGYHAAEERWIDIADSSELSYFSDLPEVISTSEMREIISVMDKPPDKYIVRVINRTFLKIVGSHYWRLIEQGAFATETNHAEILTNSLPLAFQTAVAGLSDLDYVFRQLGIERIPNEDLAHSAEELKASPELAWPQFWEGDFAILDRLSKGTALQTVCFNICMIVVVLLNTSYALFAEDIVSDEPDHCTGIHWLLIHLLFVIAYSIELIVRLRSAAIDKPFASKENIFDCILVTLYAADLIVEAWVCFIGPLEASRWVFARLNRALAFCRLFQILRLARTMMLVVGGPTTADGWRRARLLELQMSNVKVLKAFVIAHVGAQNDFMSYFCEGRPDQCEVARCIVESQTMIYRALTLLHEQTKHVDRTVLKELDVLRQSSNILNELSHFVEEAFADGALDARQARELLHPFESVLKQIRKALVIPTKSSLDKASATCEAAVLHRQSVMMTIGSSSSRSRGFSSSHALPEEPPALSAIEMRRRSLGDDTS